MTGRETSALSGQTVLQFQWAAPRGHSGLWVLCRYEDLVGRGKGNRVTYDADGNGKCQVAIQLTLK